MLRLSKEIAAQIAKKEADYVLALKGNQGCLHGKIADAIFLIVKTYYIDNITLYDNAL